MHTIVILVDNEAPDEALKKRLKRLFPECRIEVRFKNQTAAECTESTKPGNCLVKQ